MSITPVRNLKYVGTTTKTKEAGYLGVSPQVHSYYAALPVTQVPGYVGDQIGQGVSAIGSYPSKIASLWGTVFEGKPRDPTGAIGVVGIGRLGGDIAQSNVFNAPGQGVRADQLAGDREPAPVLLQPPAVTSA